MTQSTIRRPSSGWRCFGVALFMRVPIPPAITTAASDFAMSVRSGWGARIRTWDHGTKTRGLTAWLRPRAVAILAAVNEEIGEPEDGDDDQPADESPLHNPPERGEDKREQLRRREDPEHLTDDVRLGVPAEQMGQHGDDRESHHRPLRQVVGEDDDEALKERDRDRNADAVETQAAAEAWLNGGVRSARHAVNRTSMAL